MRRHALATIMVLCAWAGVLAFASTSALAKTGHVFSSTFTGSGAHALSEPTGVAVNNETGDVYVVDTGNDRVEEFSSTGATLLAEFNGSVGPPQSFSSPEAIAVDNSGSGLDPSAGDVYVVDTGHNVIDKFSATGTYEGQLTGTCASAGTCPGSVIPFGSPLRGVAVDPEGNVWVDAGEEIHVDEFSDTGSFVKGFSNGFGSEPGFAVDSSDNVYLVNPFEGVSKYESSGTALTEFFGFSSDASALAIDPATNDLFVDRASSIAQYGPFGEPFSEPLATFPSEGLSGSDGIAVSNAGTVFATQREAGSVEIFDEAPYPEVGAEPVSNRAVSSVTLNGTVNPEGAEVTSCEFEYGTEAGVYPQKEPCAQTLPLTGRAPVPVSANLTGLPPDTTYHYRLAAENVDKLTEVTTEQEFTTRGAGISDESVENVEPTAATLQARINSNESATTYHFEFDTSPYNTSASHGRSLPVPNADIGSGTSPVPVSVQLKGLQPGTSYHYRVVAVSELAPGDFETFDGPDKTLTTSPPPTEAHGEDCANEQMRTEQPFALELPDCRAYEMVSPLDKNDGDAVEAGADTVVRASLSGEAITYNARGSFAEPAGGEFESQYLSSRGVGGWSTTNITPPYKAYQTTLYSAYRSLAFTPELSAGITETDVPLTSEALPELEDLYVADLAGASYQLVSSNKASARSVPEVVGASSDLSHVLFEDERTIYEWADGRLSVVDQGNVEAGGGSEHETEGSHFWRAMSDNGARIFMTSPGSFDEPDRQLYVRENPEQEQSPLSGEECTVPSDACTVEVSASQKTNGSDPNGPQSARYWGASVDGSRVFFTSCEKLTNEATAASPTASTEDPCKPGAPSVGNDLYEYDLESKQLTDLTVDPKNTDGAAVLGVVGISEDGSYVYFVAEGELAARAVAGQPNLYLDHDGAVTFIATLKPGRERYAGDASDWFEGPTLDTVRETPDGTHLAFLSSMSLTGYDNEQAATGECEELGRGEGGDCREVFSYDATSGTLVCVSCNPSGASPVGPSSFGDEEGNASSQREDYTPRSFSEDGGRLFFQSRDALVPQDSNGLQDVYEYEDGHVYPISDVAGGYESSFLDASASGSDVFIATTDQLLPQDTDFRTDVYDARVGGGYPISTSPPACDSADACKAPVSPQPAVFGAPASSTFSGAGNLAPIVPLKSALKPEAKAKPKQCKKGFVRRHGKCAKKAKKKTNKASRHSAKGRK